MQDVKRTLRAIATSPEEARLDHLDGLTYALVASEGWKAHRAQLPEQLAPSALAACALSAFHRLRPSPGRPSTDPIAITLVRDILGLLGPGATPRDRNKVLEEALRSCGLLASDKNLGRLLAQARRGAGQKY
ncbi:MAG: hypothetical protein JNL30_01135 [Rubrivivax sp.]|nr:hypothetical protein [Rubrivivax sp.]